MSANEARTPGLDRDDMDSDGRIWKKTGQLQVEGGIQLVCTLPDGREVTSDVIADGALTAKIHGSWTAGIRGELDAIYNQQNDQEVLTPDRLEARRTGTGGGEEVPESGGVQGRDGGPSEGSVPVLEEAVANPATFKAGLVAQLDGLRTEESRKRTERDQLTRYLHELNTTIGALGAALEVLDDAS